MDNKSGGEEEFKFVDDQNTSTFQSAAKVNSAAGGMDAQRKRKLFIIIGGIIALFCLYKLYGLFSSTPSAHKTEMPVAVAAVAPEAAKPAVIEAAPMPAPEPAPAPVPTVATTPATASSTDNSAEIVALNDQVNSLGQMINTDRMAIQDLQSQMSGLSTAINNFQNQLATMQQTKVAAEQKQEVKKKAVAKKIAKPVVATTYYVKAMIQGRAWLTTTDGATFTVIENQNLPGYGTVESIDPNEGVVMTSSGRVIGYPSEDR